MVSSNRLGYSSALAMVLIGIAYVLALAAGFAMHPGVFTRGEGPVEAARD